MDLRKSVRNSQIHATLRCAYSELSRKARYQWLELGSQSPGGVGLACILRPVRFQVEVSMLKWFLLMSRWQLRKF